MASKGGNTPEEWCTALSIPCYFNDTIEVISQPSSTIITLVLVVCYFFFGFMTLFESFYSPQEIHPTTRPILSDRLVYSFSPLVQIVTCHPIPATTTSWKYAHKSRLCYAFALIGFGISVSFAAASYQALTWQLNCKYASGPCVEPDGTLLYSVDVNAASIIYLVTQVASYHILSLGDTYRVMRKYVPLSAVYGVTITIAYTVWCCTVRFHNVDDLWRASILVSAPPLLVSLCLNALVRYELRLLIAWAVLVCSTVAYLIYDDQVDEEANWRETGYWFHSNDLLHVVVFFYPPALWLAGGLAEDAPTGSALITDDQAEGDVPVPELPELPGPGWFSSQQDASGEEQSSPRRRGWAPGPDEPQ